MRSSTGSARQRRLRLRHRSAALERWRGRAALGASARRLNSTSSMPSRNGVGCPIDGSCPALTMPCPCRLSPRGTEYGVHRSARYRCRGTRRRSSTRRPRHAHTAALCGCARQLDEAMPYSLCSSMPVATAKMLGSKMMSSGESRPCRPGCRRRACRWRTCARGVGCLFSKAITTTAAP